MSRRREPAEGSDFDRTDDRRAAFSLIEILVVMVLLGVLVALALPQFTPQAAGHLEAAAGVLAADLAYARNLATTNGSTYRIEFDPARQEYVLRHSGSNSLLNDLPSSPYASPGDRPDEQVTRLAEIPVSSPSVRLAYVLRQSDPPAQVTDIEFTSAGGTSSRDATVIWLSCGQGVERRFLGVSVDPTTGLARIGEVQTRPPGGMPYASPEAGPLVVP